jgi:hypothetical protein
MNLLPARSLTLFYIWNIQNCDLSKVDTMIFMRHDTENLRTSLLAYGDDVLDQYAYSKSNREIWEKFSFSKQFLKLYFGYHIPRIHEDRRKTGVLQPRGKVTIPWHQLPGAHTSYSGPWVRNQGREGGEKQAHMFGRWRESVPRHSTKLASHFGKVITRNLLMLPLNPAGPEQEYCAACKMSSFCEEDNLQCNGWLL